MTFGYIKINDVIAQVFINQRDELLQEQLKQLKSKVEGMQVILQWDNFHTDRTLDQLEEFMRTK